MVEEKLGEFGGARGLVTWYNVGHLSKSVDKDED